MLFLILQQKNWLETRFRQLFTQELPSSVQLEKVELTAILDFQDSPKEINNNLDKYLGKAWMLTQNTCPTSDIIQWRKQTRSTDVCDIIQLEDHRSFMVDSAGFKQLKQDPIIHISQSFYPPRDEPGDPIEKFSTLSHRWSQDTVLKTHRMGWYYQEFCEVFETPGQTYQRLRRFK